MTTNNEPIVITGEESLIKTRLIILKAGLKLEVAGEDFCFVHFLQFV